MAYQNREPLLRAQNIGKARDLRRILGEADEQVKSAAKLEPEIGAGRERLHTIVEKWEWFEWEQHGQAKCIRLTAAGEAANEDDIYTGGDE